MSTLRVHLCPLGEVDDDTALQFEILDGARRVLERGCAVPSALPRVARTELVVAAPDALLLDATLPRLSGSRLRAALPALAEPMLLVDMEQAFVVAGRADSTGRCTLAVVDRNLMRRALDFLARRGIRPASATPEPLTLPAVGGRWRLRVNARYACLRMGDRMGIVCSCGSQVEPPVELRLALGQAGAARPEAIEVEGACDAAAWSSALGANVLSVAADIERATPVALEMLQYEFAPRTVEWRDWRLPAALALTLALVGIAGLNVQAWLELREERQLRGQMIAEFRGAFPQVPAVLDPLAQIRRGLADLRTGAGVGDSGDFIPLAASFARSLQVEAASVRKIEYGERVLHVHFEPHVVDSSSKRDALVEGMSQAGLVASFSGPVLRLQRGRGS